MSDKALDEALTKCRETHRGVGACYDHDYLMARHEYHKLLVERRMLSPKLAEPNPNERRRS